MASTDIKNTSRVTNADLIAQLPVTSDAPANGQVLVYDTATGYWRWRDIFTADTAQTITDPVTFDSTLTIGANGTVMFRLDTFVGDEETLTPVGTRKDFFIDIDPDFNTNSVRVIGTLAAPNAYIHDTLTTLFNVSGQDFDYSSAHYSGTAPSSQGRFNGIIFL